MSAARASYHHGSLREVLVRACLDLIRAEGIGAVSLRRVAREAGVSPGAPYHHFADRAALLTAISVQGSEMLEKRLRAARSAAPTPVAALAALVETYVRFAHEQPGYFHLTCRPELARSEGGEWTCQVLYEAVVDCQREGTVPAGQPGPIIGMVWALAHGLASLWVDGPLETLSTALADSPEDLTRQVADGLGAILTGAARAGVRFDP